MELGAVLLLLVLLVVVVLFVSWPFTRRLARHPEDNLERFALQTERERVLNALQELDFDQSLGKVPEEEYPGRRSELLQKGAAILRQLDALDSSASKISPQRRESKGNRGPAAPRSEATEKSASLSDEDLEDLIAKRRASRKDKMAGFCPKCGKPALQSDMFCPSCGEALRQ